MFERKGIVSIWIGQRRVEPGSDFLREKFGVEDADPDNQECIVREVETPLDQLVSRLSYSFSFHDALIRKATDMGLRSGLWLFAQYDFAYDPRKAGTEQLPIEPLYIGRFDWHE